MRRLQAALRPANQQFSAPWPSVAIFRPVAEILAALARHDLRCDERLNCAMAKAAVAIRAVLLSTAVK